VVGEGSMPAATRVTFVSRCICTAIEESLSDNRLQTHIPL
jgi:hypothetical protein